MCAGYQEINGRMKEICVGVRVVSVPDLHNASIRQISYHPPSSSLVSCSSDPKASLVIRAPDHNTKTYTFVIPKGVRAFATEWQLHIVVTGSSDGRLRVWNPYLPAAPLSVLPPSPNRAPPAAVLIWSQKRVIITCDADCVVRFYGLEGGRCIQTIQLKFPGGSTGLALRPLTLLQSGRIIIACRDYLATITPVPPSQSSSQLTPAPDFSSLHSELLSDAESDAGEGKTPSQVLVDDDDEEEEDDEAERKEDKILKDSTLLSAHEKRECMRMRRLVRQGATFCCLKLCKVSPPNIPLDLPLPPRLANLGLTASDPVALLAHLPVSATSNSASMQTPRSAPASARSPSARLASARSRGHAGRPSSAQKSASSKSPRSAALADNHSEVLGSRKHLSPGWRPQQSTIK
ncbi:uncharacterized protein [Palaemon carinicauda]|uniref:uncharacterized protein n=1 Tax=Palaemon carinicauda TaxID=392227 RepID=UPI0035B69921